LPFTKFTFLAGQRGATTPSSALAYLTILRQGIEMANGGITVTYFKAKFIE
jgi:hypothetical protein